MPSSRSDASAASTQATILLVDDTPQNLTVLGELLQPIYRIKAANAGERALRIANMAPAPDLILLDVMMPGMDGYEVLRQLRANPATRHIPVIFITAMDGSANEEFGLSLGAVDYITKPIVPAIVLARVRAQLELKAARDVLARDNAWLEEEVARRMREKLIVQELSVRALACLAEARDTDTGRHIVRTQIYVRLLAEQLAEHERFQASLAGDRLEMTIKAAPLHDIGKVGIPDAILLKPGKLSPDELTVMRTHPQIGADAIKKAIQQAQSGELHDIAELSPNAFAFFEIAHDIALSHHEKWDGSGYPNGLAGDNIPVSARLMALADVFDALMNRRVYKPPMTLDAATDILLAGKGSHFDPAVIDAFIACKTQFAETAERFVDADE